VFFNNHLKEVPIPGPEYVKLAHAYGIPAKRVTHQEDVLPALRAAQNHNGPYLIEFVVNPNANVYPMVPPGGSLGDTMEDPLTSSTS
jgi:acetolactate synthase I/II/III large subunit